MRHVILLLTMFLTALFSRSYAEDRVLTVVADKWCPFNCSDAPGDRGILVELAAQALAPAGIRLSYIEIPWSRAIVEVREGNYDAIVGASPIEAAGFYFTGTPLAIARYSFFTLPSSSWEYRDIESLQTLRIGVIQGYSYGGLAEDYLNANLGDDDRLVALGGNEVLPRLIKMLELGRIDALLAEEMVLDYYFSSNGLPFALRNAGLARTEDLYVAFSPELHDGAKLADLLNQSIADQQIRP